MINYKNILGDEIGSAEIIKNDNNDLTAVNAARVSFNKTSDVFTMKSEKEKGSDEGLVNYLAKHQHWVPFSHIQCVKNRLMRTEEFAKWVAETQDKQFYRYVFASNDYTVSFIERGSFYSYVTSGEIPSDVLDIPNCIKAYSDKLNLSTCKHGLIVDDISDLAFDERGLKNYMLEKLITWTNEAYNLVSFSLRYKMPIFVARQWFKHMIGFSRSEVSRRYVDTGAEFFLPTDLRLSAENVKQGSSLETVQQYEGNSLVDLFSNSALLAEMDYDYLHNEVGVCAEQSRILFPQNMYTEFYETGTKAAYNRLFKQRCEKSAQLETQKYALAVRTLLQGELNNVF